MNGASPSPLRLRQPKRASGIGAWFGLLDPDEQALPSKGAQDVGREDASLRQTVRLDGWHTGQQQRSPIVKEVSVVQVLFRNLARFAALSGVLALLGWLTWVMLDVGHMQSGFTLPY